MDNKVYISYKWTALGKEFVRNWFYKSSEVKYDICVIAVWYSVYFRTPYPPC